jgi:hypothetical protein
VNDHIGRKIEARDRQGEYAFSKQRAFVGQRIIASCHGDRFKDEAQDRGYKKTAQHQHQHPMVANIPLNKKSGSVTPKSAMENTGITQIRASARVKMAAGI